MISVNNKKIAKNSLYLYVRMLFLMLVTFFTSRVILDKLGFVDFGIYNVVGGMATMFIFFRSSLTNATQRYLNFALGKNDVKEANNIFCQHQTLYIIIAVFVILIGEVVGLYFLYEKLVIPPDRLNAAFWVYQFTILSMGITILSVSYNSVIIARENMKIYSYIGLVDGLAKLLIAYAISIIAFDRLIVYGFLLFMVHLSVVLFYYCYCRRNFEESNYSFRWDKKAIKEASSFISWNLLGTAVYVVNDQGINILLNLFFGPIVNAARGIVLQINHALVNFSDNLMTAVRPQLVKSYAARDYSYLRKLFYSSSRFSFFVQWYISLPLFLCLDTILNIWLNNVPPYTSSFAFWILAYSLVNSLNNPIWSIALAVGRLKWYILIGSGIFLLTFPIVFVLFKLGYSPVSAFIVLFVVRAIYIVVVLYILKKYVSIPICDYLVRVIFPIIKVLLVSGIICTFISSCITDSFQKVILMSFVTFFVTTLALWITGLEESERDFAISTIKYKISNLFK